MGADIDIAAALRQIDVSPFDFVMLHGDAGVAAQIRSIEPANRLSYLQKDLIDCMAVGTLIVPAFSYSFTKGENFDIHNTPCGVGQFSEAFRSLPGVKRTRHPIFSVATIGVGADEVMSARLDDCFGPGTVFDLLNQRNAKIVCLGCDFNRVTFVHYVEQLYGVSYRYLKSFSGMVIDQGKQTPVTTKYLVRDLALKTSCNLGWLKAEAIRHGALKVGLAGRYPIMSISAREFLSLAFELLRKNEYALIEQGASNYAV
jgi:aminoglycoside 3-N-acetyltransferase